MTRSREGDRGEFFYLYESPDGKFCKNKFPGERGGWVVRYKGEAYKITRAMPSAQAQYGEQGVSMGYAEVGGSRSGYRPRASDLRWTQPVEYEDGTTGLREFVIQHDSQGNEVGKAIHRT